MKNINPTVVRWVQFITFTILWLAIVYFTQGRLLIDEPALRKLPLAISGYAVLHFLFTSWLWKLPILHGWLVPFPNLHGQWKGEIRPAGSDTKGPIQAQLFIDQSFDEIKCIVRTDESESIGAAGQIEKRSDQGDWVLSYVYTNRPRVTVRDRSQMHDGATMLEVKWSRDTKRIRGEYWTTRRTVGEMTFQFVSRKFSS